MWCRSQSVLLRWTIKSGHYSHTDTLLASATYFLCCKYFTHAHPHWETGCGSLIFHMHLKYLSISLVLYIWMHVHVSFLWLYFKVYVCIYIYIYIRCGWNISHIFSCHQCNASEASGTCSSIWQMPCHLFLFLIWSCMLMASIGAHHELKMWEVFLLYPIYIYIYMYIYENKFLPSHLKNNNYKD